VALPVRVKQATLLAIGRCVEQHGPAIVGETLFPAHSELRVSQADDFRCGGRLRCARQAWPTRRA